MLKEYLSDPILVEKYKYEKENVGKTIDPLIVKVIKTAIREVDTNPDDRNIKNQLTRMLNIQ